MEPTRRAALAAMLIALALAGAPAAAHAILGGPWLSGAWVRNEVRGEFDDTEVLAGTDALYDIPTVDPGEGYRVGLGWGAREVAFEVSYALSHHQAPGALKPSGYATKLHRVDFDLIGRTGWGRRLTGGLADLTFRLGIEATHLRLNGSGYDALANPFDVEYVGGGFLVGGGAEVRAGPVRPYFEVAQRWVKYGKVLTRGREIDIDEPVKGHGPSVMAGLRLMNLVPR